MDAAWDGQKVLILRALLLDPWCPGYCLPCLPGRRRAMGRGHEHLFLPPSVERIRSGGCAIDGGIQSCLQAVVRVEQKPTALHLPGVFELDIFWLGSRAETSTLGRNDLVGNRWRARCEHLMEKLTWQKLRHQILDDLAAFPREIEQVLSCRAWHVGSQGIRRPEWGRNPQTGRLIKSCKPCREVSES